MWTPAGDPAWLDCAPFGIPRQVKVASLPIRLHQVKDDIPDIADIDLVDASEAATFASAKRAEEHVSGRWLLAWMLRRAVPNLDLASIEVVRAEHRAPELSWLQGTYRSDPFPSFSITTSHELALVAISNPESRIGIDTEPLDEPRSPNLLDMMATGEESARLASAFESQGATIMNRVWTAKEAVLKALGRGMSIPPPRIVVLGPDERILSQVEYEQQRIDLRTFEVGVKQRYAVSVAVLNHVPSEIRQPSAQEQEMLDLIASSKVEGEYDFKVGC